MGVIVWPLSFLNKLSTHLFGLRWMEFQHNNLYSPKVRCIDYELEQKFHHCVFFSWIHYVSNSIFISSLELIFEKSVRVAPLPCSWSDFPPSSLPLWGKSHRLLPPQNKKICMAFVELFGCYGLHWRSNISFCLSALPSLLACHLCTFSTACALTSVSSFFLSKRQDKKYKRI